ncbi:MAG: CAP domain-containing protein [Thermoflexibacter sp.]|jgi:hypothetical protein|nr:CAP domain-containing protein [Thermoflexibacter sp.]
MRLSLINILILLSAVFVQLYAQTNGLHSEAPLNLLKSLSSKTSLTTEERNQALGAMLQLMNEARQNPNYRRASGCKTALALPSNLTPLVFDDRLTNTAQEQADYQARIRQVTHDNRNYRDNNDGGYGARMDKYLRNIGTAEACGGSEQLADEPIGWMKSETHYRPTWNLDNQVMNAVGFGIAKGSDNVWYTVAVWANLPSPSSSLKITQPVKGNSTSNNSNAKSIGKYELNPGDRIYENEKMVSANGRFQLRGTSDGQFVIEDISAGNKEVYRFPLPGAWGVSSDRSFLSFNPDCNVCIDSKQQNRNFCATNGSDAVAPVILNKCKKARLTDDGRLVVLNAEGVEIWTNKSIRP